MAEKKVLYALDGRQFEGMIVYDDGVKAKRPVVFMQPDWKGVCPDTIGQARAVAGKDYIVLMADMFGTGHGARPKTQDELRAGMLAVHTNLPFTLACGGKAHDTLLAEARQLGLADGAKIAAIGYCATPSNRRALAPISRRSSCSTSPTPTRSWPARHATSKAACLPSTARPIR
jgi:dienelactone hydrolase